MLDYTQAYENLMKQVQAHTSQGQAKSCEPTSLAARIRHAVIKPKRKSAALSKAMSSQLHFYCAPLGLNT